MGSTNYTVARVNQIKAGGAGQIQRHNERENLVYENINVDLSRSHLNIHYKSPEGKTYGEKFKELEEEGIISTWGLKPNPTLYNEMILDVNTNYFEENGGYDFAKAFYQEAYNFAKELYGEDKIISAVMHADELNTGLSAELGRQVYHYHLHVVAIPTVRKEILWSKKCKEVEKRGTVKEVITQVSHSKMWKSEPKLDENGEPIRNAEGKIILEKSYSLLQDRFFEHMKKAGFKDFIRGEKGSTAVHLSALDFKVKKDMEKLAEIKSNIELAGKYGEKVGELKEGLDNLEGIGKKTLTGKIQLTPDEYGSLYEIAEKGIAIQKELIERDKTIEEQSNKIEEQAETIESQRSTIASLKKKIKSIEEKYQEKMEELQENFDNLVEKSRDYFAAVKFYPEEIRSFIESLKERFTKEQQKEQEKRFGIMRHRERSDDYER